MKFLTPAVESKHFERRISPDRKVRLDGWGIVKVRLGYSRMGPLRKELLVHKSSSLYRRHRFPGAIISHCVWLYYRFSLSYRDIEEMMAQRGVRVSYETIRQWCLKFGQTIAEELRRRRPQPGEKWHLDEVYIKIDGRNHYLWRAVDQGGVVLDVLVQSRRNKGAAMRFLRRLLTGMRYAPRVIVTDKLKSYGAAIKELES
jgi:putative transposase